MEKLTLKEGKVLVKLARKIIEAHFSGEKIKIPKLEILEEERGIFVTLKRFPGNELRGCIGYTEGIMPLNRAIQEISLASAFNDPRFHPVRKDELKNLLVEVSILTLPELIKVNDPRDYPKKIKIPGDGLIVEKDFRKGLLLPQVPVEWKWNVEEFLSHTCMKAGLTPDSWLNSEIKIYKFSAEVFSEEKPEGEVVMVKL